ncbi:hypothetical protein GCM10012286_20390 [Streptomyces lasiicapitis]|uniref:Uncharacterized protein n=1 Tax=Streptomyces lasiicapitis TaxID=1923961 RepID=A0ABQ2LNX3_9ACTN|nr:hypothetical protein GCM10012286_20390 [Streptomyces lasiicapitis]
MGGGERLHDLAADGGGLARVERAALTQDVVQGGAVDKFHDDQRASFDLRHVVHGDDSGVPHAGGGAGLTLHPQAQVGEFGPARVRERTQFLDRDLAVQDLVDGAPHDAHAAAAELPEDAIAPGEESADPVRLLLFPRRHRCPVPVTPSCLCCGVQSTGQV